MQALESPLPKKARPDLLARLGPRPSEIHNPSMAPPRRSLRLQGVSLAAAQVACHLRDFLGGGWVGGILGTRLTATL